MTTAADQPISPAAAYDDAAWVRIATPLSVADLRLFLEDIERLYRINPLLDIAVFQPAGRGRYRLVAHNHSNGQDIEVGLAVAATDTGLEVTYEQGLKASTQFRVEATPHGSHLFVTDVYGGGSAEERRARADEVDLSLNAWGRALHAYLQAWARWSWFAPWRWYMRRVWQPMKPSARRIVWMIWVISAFEVIAASVLLAIWVLARQVLP
jgi:hypothetical protein